MVKLAVSIQKLSRAVCWVAVAAAAVMMLLTFVDVILRCFGYAIQGAYDIITVLGVLVFAIPIAYTQTEKMHISIDFLVENMPRKLRIILDAINYMLNITVYAILALYSLWYGNKLMKVGQVSETVQIPLYPFLYIISFSSGLMVLALLSDIVIDFRRGGTK